MIEFFRNNYIVHSNGSLTIKEVGVDGDGVYRCTAINKAGNSSAQFKVCE